MTREEAVTNLESFERVLAQQEADELTASAAFDQASAHLAEVHTRVVVGRQQVYDAQLELMRAFELPLAFMADLFAPLRGEVVA